MDAAGQQPDRSTADVDAVPAGRAPWGTRGRLAVAVAALAVAVVVAAVALRSVHVDLGGPVSVAAGATAEGGDDLHRVEPVATAQPSSTTADPTPSTDPTAPTGSGGALASAPTGGPGGGATGGASGLTGSAPTGGSSSTTTLAGGVLPGVTVPPPSDVTAPVVNLLPPPLDSTVSTLLKPIDPLLQPLDPLLGGLLGPGTTTTTVAR